jgi:1,4-alpha-glucan branching enzyme
MTRTKPSSAASLGEGDLPLFGESTHARRRRKPGWLLGDGVARFAVWSPNAETVEVFGDFSGRQAGAHPAWGLHSLSLPLSGQGVRHGVS